MWRHARNPALPGGAINKRKKRELVLGQLPRTSRARPAGKLLMGCRRHFGQMIRTSATFGALLLMIGLCGAQLPDGRTTGCGRPKVSCLRPHPDPRLPVLCRSRAPRHGVVSLGVRVPVR